MTHATPTVMAKPFTRKRPQVVSSDVTPFVGCHVSPLGSALAPRGHRGCFARSHYYPSPQSPSCVVFHCNLSMEVISHQRNCVLSLTVRLSLVPYHSSSHRNYEDIRSNISILIICLQSVSLASWSGFYLHLSVAIC